MVYLDKNPNMSPSLSHPNKLSASITNKNEIKIKISNFRVNALIDTNANISVVAKKTWTKEKKKKRKRLVYQTNGRFHGHNF